jgi:hypothetical protein
VFHRGPNALTCALEAAGNRSSYDVCILPHWDLSLATVEHFDAPASALLRHANIQRDTISWRVGLATRQVDGNHRKYIAIAAKTTSNTATMMIQAVEPRPNRDGDTAANVSTSILTAGSRPESEGGQPYRSVG